MYFLWSILGKLLGFNVFLALDTLVSIICPLRATGGRLRGHIFTIDASSLINTWNILGFNGCLLLDPLRLISFPLRVIVGWVKVIDFHCRNHKC